MRGVGGTGPRKIQKEATFDDLVPKPSIQMQKLTVEYRQRFPFFYRVCLNLGQMCEAWVAVTPTNPCRAFFSACLTGFGAEDSAKQVIYKYIYIYIKIDVDILYMNVYVYVYVYECVCVCVCEWPWPPTNPCRAFFLLVR